MNSNYVLLFAAAFILLGGCASVPIKDISVDAHVNPKANFDGYKTYTWLGSAAIVNDPYGQWEPPAFDADAEIKYLIDRELRKRGMLQSSTDPDVIVAFAAGIDMDALELQIDPQSKMENLTNVPRGGLIIAFVDSQSGFVIWLGVATADIQEQPDTKTVKARLEFAVTQLLQMFPK
jgi:uncharacterized protein YceK